MGDGIRRESGETLRKISLSSSRKQVGRSYTCRSPFLASRSLSTLSCSKENSSSSFLSTSLPFPLPLLLSPLSLSIPFVSPISSLPFYFIVETEGLEMGGMKKREKEEEGKLSQTSWAIKHSAT